MLLTNGRIYTLDAADAVVDTLVVRDGRILFAGRRHDANVPAAEETIDLGGRAVLPGLVDCHAHLMHLARTRLALDVSGLRSEEAIARRVAEAAAAAAPGDWLGGRGWDQNLWPERRFPAKASLDRAAPRNPVSLTRVDGHATWANSLALQAAGIGRATRDPSGGRVVKGRDGEPTGLLIDTAQEDPNPFHGIYAAVARRPLSGEERGWQLEQRMTREEAVRAFTTWAAYAAHQEAELGSLEVGKRADLVVCSDDVLTCPEERIKAVVPMLTMVGGEVAFSRAG